MLDADRTRELLDRVGESILALDTNHHVIYLNRTAEQLLDSAFDLVPSQVLHQPLAAAVPQLIGTRFEAAVRELAATPGDVEFEEEFPVLGRWFAIRVAATTTGALCCLRDVTDRRAAQHALSRWAKIFEHAGWGVAIVSADGCTIETVNLAFARMHGWDVEGLAGRSTSVLRSSSPDAARNDNAVERLMRERGHHVWEAEHRRRDGSVFPIRIDATVVSDAAGEPLYRAINVQDLTEHKRVEEQIRQAQKMEVVGRLAGGIAHDFNNMMMIVQGFGDLLMTSLAEDDPRRADAAEIRKAADRAQQLTRQLLGFGRRQLVAREVLGLNGLVEGLERMIGPLLGENIHLVTKLAAEPCAVEADYGQLEQVVMNLALNARDAMRAGGRLTIETFNVILSRRDGYERAGIEIPAGPYVALRISDTGHGMTPEVKARLFEPFFTTKAAERNTGLGLATVYTIVTQSAGYIQVDSELDQGAVFTIYLPHALSEEETIRDAFPLPVPVGGSETILVVEDDEVVRRLACRLLESHGYTVLDAASGLEALELALATDTPIDLILADVVMPDIGGQALVAQLLPRFPELRVVYMSGYTEDDKLMPGTSDSAHAFLPKPFPAASLAQAVREALDQSVLRR